MFRDIAKGVARNTSIMLFQQVITWASTFLLMLFLPRYLGPVEYGKLFLALSITQIFQTLISYGGGYLVAKDVSRSRQDTAQILVDAVSFRLIFGIVAIACMVFFSYWVEYPGTVKVLLVISGLTLLWQGGSTALYASYQGHELMQYTSAAAVVDRVFVSIVGVIALLLGAHVIVIAIIMTVGSLLYFIVLAGFLRKIITSLPKVNWAGVVRQIKDGAPYFLFTVFSSVYYRIDSLMLSKMTPEAVMGWYGGAYRLFEAFNFLPSIFTLALYPVVSRLWSEEGQTHRRTTQKSLEFMIIAGVPVTAFGIVFGRQIIQFFYGLADYSPSVIVLQVLSAGLLLLYVDMVLGTTLLASDRQLKLSVLSLSAIPLNVLLNYVLIPLYQTRGGNGGVGAAIATGLTEIFIMLVALKLLPQGILRGFRFSVVARSILSGLVMSAALVLMGFVGVPWLARLFVGLVLYFISQFILGTFEPSEREFVRGWVSVQRLKVLERMKIF
jgi:O-antigen/teichoic acid export membrane protein